jgi:predicted transcriptional regulator
MLSNKISEIDAEAKNIIESTLPKLLHIQNILERAVEDSKSKNPSYIYNIKTINGLANKAFINQLKNIANKIKQFLNIMRNFHLVTKAQLKKKKS